MLHWTKEMNFFKWKLIELLHFACMVTGGGLNKKFVLDYEQNSFSIKYY